MRSTEELIQELDREAGNFTHCGLVIGFESSTIYIWGHDPNRQRALDEAVDAGGEPIGVLGCDMRDGLLSVQVRALEEHAHEDSVAEYLHKLADDFHQSLLKTRPARDIEED
jgi:hypothetical protein